MNATQLSKALPSGSDIGSPRRHRVVIVGGGFGGLHAARALSRSPVDVILIDRENHHLFQPLLYQVATGGLSAANIASPLRSLFRKKKNVWVRQAEVTDIDLMGKLVRLGNEAVAFDSLIVASGVCAGYFGHPEWAELAPPLKSLSDAEQIRNLVLGAFEAAEWESDPSRKAALLTFVVVGGGPSGVELAGAIAELARATEVDEFINIDTRSARILLFHGEDRLLPAFGHHLSKKAQEGLRKLGVTVHLSRKVVHIGPGEVHVQSPDAVEILPTNTVLWTAGTQGSPLGETISRQANLTLDRLGRIPVQMDMSVAGHPSVYVIGDLARFQPATGDTLPGLAPVAIQQGRFVARRIRCNLKGKQTKPFRYIDKGNLATIGRRLAVGRFGRFSFSGWLAWTIWAFVHLMYLVGYESRLLVFVQWGISYISQNRGARLITQYFYKSRQERK